MDDGIKILFMTFLILSFTGIYQKNAGFHLYWFKHFPTFKGDAYFF